MILIIQSGGIVINPVPIQRVIRGYFHQETKHLGKWQVHSVYAMLCIQLAIR